MLILNEKLKIGFKGVFLIFGDLNFSFSEADI